MKCLLQITQNGRTKYGIARDFGEISDVARMIYSAKSAKNSKEFRAEMRAIERFSNTNYGKKPFTSVNKYLCIKFVKHQIYSSKLSKMKAKNCNYTATKIDYDSDLFEFLSWKNGELICQKCSLNDVINAYDKAFTHKHFLEKFDEITKI